MAKINTIYSVGDKFRSNSFGVCILTRVSMSESEEGLTGRYIMLCLGSGNRLSEPVSIKVSHGDHPDRYLDDDFIHSIHEELQPMDEEDYSSRSIYNYGNMFVDNTGAYVLTLMECRGLEFKAALVNISTGEPLRVGYFGFDENDTCRANARIVEELSEGHEFEILNKKWFRDKYQ